MKKTSKGRTRSRQVHLWLTEAEHRQLYRVAKVEEMTASALLRYWIKLSSPKSMKELGE